MRQVCSVSIIVLAMLGVAACYTGGEALTEEASEQAGAGGAPEEDVFEKVGVPEKLELPEEEGTLIMAGAPAQLKLPWSPSCAEKDLYEYGPPPGNDTINTSSQLTWSSVSGGSGVIWAWVVVDDAFLCSGNDDWYHLPSPFSTVYDNEVMIKVRALAKGAPLCYGCGQPGELPPAPENTLSVDVHQATGPKPLLSTATGTRGNVSINHTDPSYEDGVLLRFYGPPAAEYDYRFSVMIQDFDGEDECEDGIAD